MLFIDGFAGPGEYSEGEEGSPILALKVASEHALKERLTRAGMELSFTFIESDRDRHRNLKKKLSQLNLPNNFRVQVVHGTFEQTVGSMMDYLDDQNSRMAPSLVFIDPFGPTGFPLDLVARVAEHPRSEVLINFAYQPLNRWFLGDFSKHARLDELFGSNRWRPALKINDPQAKESFLVNEYHTALMEQGWRGRTFRMINKHNQTQYYLFFGTKHPLGMQAMKQAMWRAAPEGDFRYSDITNPNQPRLFSGTADENISEELSEMIFKNYKGTAVSKANLLDNDVAWHPTALPRHLTRAMKILEYESTPTKIVQVRKANGTSRKKGTYPNGCLITFAT